jgi:hypothetical protein
VKEERNRKRGLGFPILVFLSRFSRPGFPVPVFPSWFSRPGFPGANPRGQIFRLGFREEKMKVPGLGLENGNGKIRVLSTYSQLLFRENNRIVKPFLLLFSGEAHQMGYLASGKLLKVGVEFSLEDPQGGIHFVVPEGNFGEVNTKFTKYMNFFCSYSYYLNPVKQSYKINRKKTRPVWAGFKTAEEGIAIIMSYIL